MAAHRMGMQLPRCIYVYSIDMVYLHSPTNKHDHALCQDKNRCAGAGSLELIIRKYAHNYPEAVAQPKLRTSSLREREVRRKFHLELDAR